MKVLVVEDAEKLARFLARVLTEEGYVVDHCASGRDGLDQAQRGDYQVIVLDWMLPDLDGLSLCRELRRRGSTTPILMLTARGETAERVLGLEAGADDYLVKPFEIEELVARVRALVRRATGFPALSCGSLKLDRLRREVLLEGEPLALTSREYVLLLHLLLRADQKVGRSELLSSVWETHIDPGSNLLEVHVSRLRDKLGRFAWMIETVRGFGYRLRTSPPKA